jgi:hypothetical protein
VRALAANGQTAAMAQAAVAADVHQPLDVHLDLLAKIALDHPLLVNYAADAIDFLFAQLANALINAYPGLFKYLVGARTPDPIYVRKTDLGSLICRQVHT